MDLEFLHSRPYLYTLFGREGGGFGGVSMEGCGASEGARPRDIGATSTGEARAQGAKCERGVRLGPGMVLAPRREWCGGSQSAPRTEKESRVRALSRIWEWCHV